MHTGNAKISFGRNLRKQKIIYNDFLIYFFSSVYKCRHIPIIVHFSAKKYRKDVIQLKDNVPYYVKGKGVSSVKEQGPMSMVDAISAKGQGPT